METVLDASVLLDVDVVEMVVVAVGVSVVASGVAVSVTAVSLGVGVPAVASLVTVSAGVVVASAVLVSVLVSVLVVVSWALGDAVLVAVDETVACSSIPGAVEAGVSVAVTVACVLCSVADTDAVLCAAGAAGALSVSSFAPALIQAMIVSISADDKGGPFFGIFLLTTILTR